VSKQTTVPPFELSLTDVEASGPPNGDIRAIFFCCVQQVVAGMSIENVVTIQERHIGCSSNFNTYIPWAPGSSGVLLGLGNCNLRIATIQARQILIGIIS